jgi:2-oxoacid dehydrogenases acyltransferase (catalytic domain)
MANFIVNGLLKASQALLDFPTGRPDGELVDRIHPYRKMLPFMMRGRNESAVYYDDPAKAENLLDYIARAEKAWGIDVNITHCLVAACRAGLWENPKMNQFIAGRRLYARNKSEITFSVKRKRMNKEAKLAAVKLDVNDRTETFRQLCERINGNIVVERSEEKTYTDKELGIFTQLPRPLLEIALNTLRWADSHNLVPGDFIKNDGFYTSIFIANLGSLGMSAGYHHLYEYGTCPLFMMVGMIEERAVVEDGKVVVRKMLPVRWTYDERIDDGLTSKYGMKSCREALENPEEAFGPIE